MSRTVSTPCGAVAIAYKTIDVEEYQTSLDWDEYVDEIESILVGAFPSLDNCDHWLGREDHAILENDHCHITISEYCGLVAIALVPKDNDFYGEQNGLHEYWCSQVTPKFNALLGEYRHVATFSNGEAVYEAINHG